MLWVANQLRTALQGLPITIPAHGESPLRFRLTTTPDESGRLLNTNIKLLLDTPSPVVTLMIVAEIGSAGGQNLGSPPSRSGALIEGKSGSDPQP